jgi:uncharacterized protein YndB with AHSA1/START domain
MSATTTQAKEFVISRTLNAPRELVWKVWTVPEYMEWWGPKGATTSIKKMDLRVGGILHYKMDMEDGLEMWGKWTFREITPPERLVLIDSFSNSEGGVTHHPLAPTWPAEMITTITFAEEAGKTRVTITWTPYNSTDEEIETFNAAHESMNGGWSGTFERLEEYLATFSS